MNRTMLEKRFAPSQIKQRKGRNGILDYVEGWSVIARLNEAFEGAWSFEVPWHEIRETEVLGSGIHGAAAFLFRGLARGARPSVADVQGNFESVWHLEAAHRPLRFGEKDTPASLLDLGTRMLAVLCDRIEPGTEVVAVEEPFAVPLIDQDTGEVLDCPFRGRCWVWG